MVKNQVKNFLQISLERRTVWKYQSTKSQIYQTRNFQPIIVTRQKKACLNNTASNIKKLRKTERIRFSTFHFLFYFRIIFNDGSKIELSILWTKNFCRKSFLEFFESNTATKQKKTAKNSRKKYIFFFILSLKLFSVLKVKLSVLLVENSWKKFFRNFMTVKLNQI